MFERKKIQSLNDFFTALNKRKDKAVYFYRISGYNSDIEDFIFKYYSEARTKGTVIEGKIQNPDEKNLSFYEEMMGDDFQLEKTFVVNSLKKWLPRANAYQCSSVAESLYNVLSSLKRLGKSDGVLKNTYVKFMCWLYYKFEKVVCCINSDDVPKILYEGYAGRYELMFLSMICFAGCDVLLLHYDGDDKYLSQDPKSIISDALKLPNMSKFPADFSLKWVRQEMQDRAELDRLYGQKPSITNCTNAWIKGEPLSDIKKTPATRGEDSRYFYNCFSRIWGVEDKVTYPNELYQFQLEIRNSKRNLLILENGIPQPTAEEIARVDRKNYADKVSMIADFSSKIIHFQNAELRKLAVKCFIDSVMESSKEEGMTLTKLTNRSLCLLCWINRYFQKLFAGWAMPLVSCFVYLGGCKNEYEVAFLKTLARMPCDVLILVPNLNKRCTLTDELLFELKFNNSLEVETFPTESSGLRLATAAYHAERELDEVIYTDSGMYRSHQYNKANSLTLKTMYEEIELLWNEELRFRPNFSTVDDVVNMPVLFAKVSGVKDGQVQQYWQSVKSLINEDTLVISSVPYINPMFANPMKQGVTEFFKNGKLQRDAIRRSRFYRYGVMREETQNYIFDKLQLLIDQRLINGTFINGTEYNIVSTVLNMQTDLLRLIQKFDFTRKNPKVVYINTTENLISQEDAILMAFLNLVGFDVVFFVPTGYQSVERHYTKSLMDEHQIGEYMYDLRTPNIGVVSGSTGKGAKKSWMTRLFKKGR